MAFISLYMWNNHVTVHVREQIGRPIHPPADEPFTFGSSGGALVSPPLPLLPNRQISSAVRIETAAERRWRLTSK